MMKKLEELFNLPESKKIIKAEEKAVATARPVAQNLHC
jgi:hypothetical protein